MSAITQKKIDFVSNLRIKAKALIGIHRDLLDLRAEYVALGYDSDDLAEGCVGGNEGLTGSDCVGVIVSIDNLDAYMAAGNATNLYKVVA